MSHFNHRNALLQAEGVPLTAIAEAEGTPAYVYSTAALRDAARRLRGALAFVPRKELFFAVKAKPNPAVLRVLADEGYGADIVSGGELMRARAAGIAPGHMVFSGTGKSPRELMLALDAGVGRINLEVERESEVLAHLARPALYDAWHEIEAVQPCGEHFDADVVGPVCEISDTFARARRIDRVDEGDLVVIRTAGAYGATMASTYNCRAMVPKVLVDGARFAVVADRTEAEDLGRLRLAPWMPRAETGVRAA